MKTLRLFVVLSAAAVLLAPGTSSAQPLAKPGPEHEKLKKLEGNWEASVKLPDGSESKAKASYKMMTGGMWLLSKFEGEFAGQKFEGRGMDTYDATKKKYISVWADSMSTSPLVSEGEYDKDGKALTLIGEGPGMDGKPAKLKMVSEMKDDDNMVFTMSAPDKDGKYQVMMTITYKRKK